MCKKLYIHWAKLFIALIFTFHAWAMDIDTQKQLYKLYGQDDAQGLECLLEEKKIDVNAIIDETQSLLMLAASLDAEKIGTCLLDRGADKNVRSSKGQSLMGIACSLNSLAFVKMLHARGVSLNATEKDDISPLEFAIRSYSLETADFLLENGASQSPLKVIINSNTKIHISSDTTARIMKHEYQFPLLHYAVFVNALRVCDLLCTKHAFDPNAIMPFTMLGSGNVVHVTPNDLAVMSANWRIAQLLQEKGANARSHYALMTVVLSYK